MNLNFGCKSKKSRSDRFFSYFWHLVKTALIMFGLQKYKINNLTTRLISSFCNKLTMNQVYFNYNVEEKADKMMISLRFQKQLSETKKLDKNFNFVRNVNEKIEITLNRIKNNVEREINSKSKKKVKKSANPDEELEKNQEVRLIN